MTKISKIALFISAILISAIGFAQPKLAVIDYDEAILQSDYSKSRLQELDNNESYKQLKAEVNSLKADYQALSKEVESSENWSLEKRKDFQERIQYIRADLELAGKKMNAKQQQVLQGIAYAMQDRAKTSLTELIKDEKIELLFDRKAVLSVDPSYDITNKLITKLNKK